MATVSCAGAGTSADTPKAVAAPVASSPRQVAGLQAATDATPPPVEPEAGRPEPEPVAIPGTDLVRGRATTVVDAPIDRVRESVLDFGHYAEFMPHYRNAKVLGRTPSGARDVYMEVEALYGAVKMWARVELGKPTVEDGVETHETRFVEGNVEEFKAIWRLKAVDAEHTSLSLEVFLKPKIPLPKNLLNQENLDGSVKGVMAMKARAERG
jgi:ribosome-associated toxin RatA of RatAB toxin-antitoxin module